MRKIFAICLMLITGLTQAQTFDFSCETPTPNSTEVTVNWIIDGYATVSETITVTEGEDDQGVTFPLPDGILVGDVNKATYSAEIHPGDVKVVLYTQIKGAANITGQLIIKTSNGFDYSTPDTVNVNLTSNLDFPSKDFTFTIKDKSNGFAVLGTDTKTITGVGSYTYTLTHSQGFNQVDFQTYTADQNISFAGAGYSHGSDGGDYIVILNVTDFDAFLADELVEFDFAISDPLLPIPEAGYSLNITVGDGEVISSTNSMIINDNDPFIMYYNVPSGHTVPVGWSNFYLTDGEDGWTYQVLGVQAGTSTFDIIVTPPSDIDISGTIVHTSNLSDLIIVEANASLTVGFDFGYGEAIPGNNYSEVIDDLDDLTSDNGFTKFGDNGYVYVFSLPTPDGYVVSSDLASKTIQIDFKAEGYSIYIAGTPGENEFTVSVYLYTNFGDFTDFDFESVTSISISDSEYLDSVITLE